MHLKITENFRKFLKEEDWQASDIAQALAEDFDYSPYAIPRWVEAVVNQKPFIILKNCFDEKTELLKSNTFALYDERVNSFKSEFTEKIYKFIQIANEELDVKLQNLSMLQPVTSWTRIEPSESKAAWLGKIDYDTIAGLTDKESGALILPCTKDLISNIRYEYSFGLELIKEDWHDYLYEFGLPPTADAKRHSPTMPQHISDIYKGIIRSARINNKKMNQIELLTENNVVDMSSKFHLNKLENTLEASAKKVADGIHEEDLKLLEFHINGVKTIDNDEISHYKDSHKMMLTVLFRSSPTNFRVGVLAEILYNHNDALHISVFFTYDGQPIEHLDEIFINKKSAYDAQEAIEWVTEILEYVIHREYEEESE